MIWNDMPSDLELKASDLEIKSEIIGITTNDLEKTKKNLELPIDFAYKTSKLE